MLGPNKSTAWEYFGSLASKIDGKTVDENSYCNVCLESAMKENDISPIPKRNKESVCDNKSEKKWLLARNLVLWFCKDLIQFQLVGKEGLSDFLKKYNIIVDDKDLPDRTTLSRGALTDVYDYSLPFIRDMISKEQYFALTFDLWTDNYRRRSYIMFTHHYINSNFELKKINLATRFVEKRHTAEEISRLTVLTFLISSRSVSTGHG